MNRRDFLKKTTSAAALGLTAVSMPRAAWSRPAGANETIGVAVVGLGWGLRHMRRLTGMPGVRLTALCDLDPGRLQTGVEELNKENIRVFSTTEFRMVLERRDVDAVVLATPNHWHALQTIWACQAGKDVYVEKPVAQNIWEGRRMVEAATRHSRIIQGGTQGRSATGLAELIDFLDTGGLGAVKYIHAFSTRNRPGIGRTLPWYPTEVDYDLFCGRSPMVPLQRDRMHYDWHWMWDTGNGDLGNLGIHVFDRARWVAGHQGPPPRVMSLGGRFNLDDSAETPNAQLTLCSYPQIPIIIENRSLPSHPEMTERESLRGIRSGIVVQCEDGYFAGMNGGQAFDQRGRFIREFPSEGPGDHMKNFIDAVRSRRSADLKAPIDVAHTSNIGCMCGNISYRVGREAGIAEARQSLAKDLPTPGILDDFEDYLARYEVDLRKTPLRVGRWVEFDGQTETITRLEESGNEQKLAEARFLLKGTHRPPYQFPETLL